MAKKDFLSEKRTEIDLIDTQIIQLLGRRMNCAREIGNYKNEHYIPILQEDRWQPMLGNYIVNGAQEDLSEKLIKQVFSAIHDESVFLQGRISG